MLLLWLQKVGPGPGVSRSSADPRGKERNRERERLGRWHRVGFVLQPRLRTHLQDKHTRDGDTTVNLCELRASWHCYLGKLQQTPKNLQPPLACPVFTAQPGLDIFLKAPTKLKEEEQGAMGKTRYLPCSCMMQQVMSFTV